MNKVAHYLQEHLVGEVFSDKNSLDYFSRDKSIFKINPAFIVFPQNESDVRKTARFAWQLADRGRPISITARGFGNDESGAAIGKGIVLVFPTHMNNITGMDIKTGEVFTQPGASIDSMKQAINLQGRFLPPLPHSEHSTIGGALGNNTSSESSFKYGAIKYFVNGLRVVLSNGDVIETKRLSKKQLSRKMGAGGFEAKIYRDIDKLIEENQQLIHTLARGVSKNSAGYDIASIKADDGSFDLSPLFVGSEGTLGIITEASLTTLPKMEQSTLFVAHINSFSEAQDIALEIALYEERPKSMEVVDGNLLKHLVDNFPHQLNGIIDPPFPKLTMLLELDDQERLRKKLKKRIKKVFSKRRIEYIFTSEPSEVEKFKKIMHAPATFIHTNVEHAKPLPIINDGIVPLEKINDYMNMAYELFAQNNLGAYIWGHFGDGHLQMRPILDLSEVADRQKIFRIMDYYYNTIIEMGGSISGSGGDGRLRAPYLQTMYKDAYHLFEKIKQILDPKNILNTGVKLNVDANDTKSHLRKEYSTIDNLEFLQ